MLQVSNQRPEDKEARAMARSHHHNNLTVLEKCQISPDPVSRATPSSLPLTYFDLIFYRFHPVQRLFYYNSTSSLDHELPRLKQSFSLALRHYYPLAGSLERDSPHLLCSQSDTVSFTVALSRDDFRDLSGDQPRHINRLHPLVPPLNASTSRQPVFAVQVTIFDGGAIAIGTAVHHAIADGSTYSSFMKLWSHAHRLGELPDGMLPFLDRSVVRDPAGLRSAYLKDLESLNSDQSMAKWDLAGVPGVQVGTFVFSRGAINEMRHRAVAARKAAARASGYALVCGFVWAGLVRARGRGTEVGDRGKEHFGFVTGCRARMRPPLPANYFGNCLGICRVEMERGELTGADGTAVGAAEIWRVIQGLEEGAFRGAEKWVRNVHEYAARRAVTVAGSPKLGVYEVDFGWGRPRKVEMVSIERTGAMSLADGRGEEGSIEVGLALPSHEMEKFVFFFNNAMVDL